MSSDPNGAPGGPGPADTPSADPRPDQRNHDPGNAPTTEPASAPRNDPAEDFREIAAVFTARVEGVRADQWDDPTPVREWCVRDVVAHLIEWLPDVLGFPVAEIPPIADDPAAAWRAHTAGVQRLLDDPADSTRPISNPHFGELPAGTVVAMLYTPDVFLHTWDLARATGQDDRLDPERCAAGLAAVEPMEEVLRSSAQYGPPVPVPDDAPVQDRLIGFIGRDPHWTPPRDHS